LNDDLPLAGITVVEICHSVAGPYGGQILADLGAEVIKVESPGKGDYSRDWGPPFWHGAASTYHSLNRNKLGITVDFRDPAQLAALKQLIVERADVVLQNLRPGAIDAHGLDGETLMAAKPTLIYGNLGAFGRVGPKRGKPGYDPLMQACGGIMSVTGTGDGAPVRVGTSIVDMGAGMWLAVGVLAALVRRAATGQGCVVDTSLYETALAWMTNHIAGYLASGEVRRPFGSGIAEIVPHQAFATADGHLMVAAGNDGLFARLCGALGHAEWAADPRYATNSARVTNRAGIIGLLAGAFATAPSAAWMQRLDAVGVPNAPIQSVDQVVADPQTAAVGMIQPAPDKDMALVGPPLAFDGRRPPLRRSPPALGQHNAEVLKR
jgi:crotonobetainyl-CoA:carnitine CoA-transferase CaiB-like acyl-CoA transferase